MKQFILLSVALFLCTNIALADNEHTAFSAPDTSKISKGQWTTSSTPALKIDENYYSNWAASGISQVAFIGTFNGNYKYTCNKFIWDNVVDLALGIYWQDLDGDTTARGFRAFESRRKNDDKIDITSTFSMKLKKAWNINASANFKSQFLDGFKYTDTDTALVSSFMAPAYLTTSLGFECKKEFWNLSLSFLTGKTTFLLDDDVIAAGQLYGVDTSNGKRIYAGLGSYIKFYYKKDIAKNLNLYTRIELFYDYRKPYYHDNSPEFGWPDNSYLKDAESNHMLHRSLYCLSHDTDIDFEMKVEYRFSSFLAAYFSSRFKYDSDFIGVASLFGNPENHWQLYQSAGVQLYFNWKTPKTKS